MTTESPSFQPAPTVPCARCDTPGACREHEPDLHAAALDQAPRGLNLTPKLKALADAHPEQMAAARAELRAWLAQAPAAEPLTVDAVRDLIDDAGLDWHNGWTVGEDSTNRYLSLCRAVERSHGIASSI